MRRTILVAAIVSVVLGAVPVWGQAGERGPIIAREVLFGNPDKASLRVSPDGTKIGYRAAREGVMNVWVAPADDPDAAVCVTDDRLRGIRIYFWAYTNEHIL